MLALRYVYVLALVVWLGGMVVLETVVAPATGSLFDTIVHRFHFVAYSCGGVLLLTLAIMAVLGPRPASFAIRSLIIGAMLAVALYSGLAKPDAAARIRLLQVNVVGALALLYWEAREG